MQTLPSRRTKRDSKKSKQSLFKLKTGWNVIVKDESIFVYDYVVRRKKWVSADKRTIVTVTGSRRKTIIFDCLSLEGKKQLFKQYNELTAIHSLIIFNKYAKDLVNVSSLLIGQHHIVPKLPELSLLKIEIQSD